MENLYTNFMFNSLFARPDIPVECGCGDTHSEICSESGMRNHRNFPPFAYLPAEDDVDETYYAPDEEGFMYSPIRHWALAGEIVDLNFFIRPRVTIETKFGEKVLVNFHLDAPTPTFFNWPDLKLGRSMVILYAVNRTFVDMNNGVRQESPDTVMVFPTPLTKLMDEFHGHAAFEKNNTKTCFNCSAPETEEKKQMKCTRCKKAFYCDKDCQLPHWRECHKHLCRHAPMLSKLAALDFSRFDGFTNWSFPKPPTAEEKAAKARKVHRDALYRMGAVANSMTDRFGELLSSIEAKDLTSDPTTEVFISNNVIFSMLNKDTLPKTAGETFLVMSLRKFFNAISQDSKLRQYVVDLNSQVTGDPRAHHFTSDLMLSTLFFALPRWQHEESVGGISWAFDCQYPLKGSASSQIYRDYSTWFTKAGDDDAYDDSLIIKNRVSGTSAFLSDEIWMSAEIGEDIARANPGHMVIRVLRATAHESREDLIRNIASKENVPSNMYTLWIREYVPGAGLFNPPNASLGVVEQLLDVRPNSYMESMLRMLGVPEENILFPESADEESENLEDTRTCSSCCESKPKTQFSKSQLRKYGRSARCRDCVAYSSP